MNSELRKTRNAVLIAAAAAAIATGVLYLPALRNGFVNWDDNYYVYVNARITDLTPGFVAWAFTTFEMCNYHPLVWLSYALDYSLWGMNPFGFHLTSVLIHVVNTFIVALLAARLLSAADSAGQGASFSRTKVVVTAAVTGVLFGMHPLHVESVAWISERKDVLYAFFYLSSLLAYLNYATTGNRRGRYYLSALAAFILSLLSKPMAVTLPFVLFILDFFPLRRLSQGNGPAAAKKVFIEKIPFLVLAAISSVVTVLAQYSGKTVAFIETFSLGERLLTAVRAVFFYLSKFFLPVDLAAFYPILTPVTFSPGDGLMIAVLLGLTALAVRSRKRKPLWLAVWTAYLVTLLPVLGIIQVGGQAAADRYTYLPMVGPMFLSALGIAWTVERAGGNPLRRTISLQVLGLVVSICFAAMLLRTVHQIRVWRDPVSLWDRVLAVYPTNVPMVFRNRGEAHYKAGDYAKAIEDYTSAIRLDERDYRAYSARGIVRLMSGRYEAALADFDHALSIEPGYDEALYYRGLAFRKAQGHAGTRD